MKLKLRDGTMADVEVEYKNPPPVLYFPRIGQVSPYFDAEQGPFEAEPIKKDRYVLRHGYDPRHGERRFWYQLDNGHDKS